jgi:galactosamine-6-phosphate isomerase
MIILAGARGGRRRLLAAARLEEGTGRLPVADGPPPRQLRSSAVRYADRFQLIITPDYESLSRVGAEWLAVVLRRQPDALLGLATGASPALAYDLLTAQGRTEQDLLRRVRVLKTDEWGGLSLDDPGSSEAYLRQRVVGPWGLGPERFTGWASAPADPEEAAARMRAWLATHGPLDACVLGLGVNGHLLMNEPAPALQPAAHVAQLAADPPQAVDCRP